MACNVTQNCPGQISEILSLKTSKKRAEYIAGGMWCYQEHDFNSISHNMGSHKIIEIKGR